MKLSRSGIGCGMMPLNAPGGSTLHLGAGQGLQYLASLVTSAKADVVIGSVCLSFCLFVCRITATVIS